MDKKIVIINGSARYKGNTDEIVKNIMQGAQSANASTKHFILRDVKISDCKGCNYCYKNDSCSLKDEMQNIHSDIQESDLVILAFPLYWGGFTGLMQTFIDRLYLYYPERNGHLIKGKKFLLVVPMRINEEQHGIDVFNSDIEPLKLLSKNIFKRLGINLLDIVFYTGLFAKNDARKNVKYMDSSYELGQKLIHLR